MIGLTTGLIMLASALPAQAYAFASSTNVNFISTIPAITATTSTVQESTTTKLSLKDFDTTEEYVRAYYKNTPILAEIARCESQFRQYDAKGNILRGTVDKDDIGIMQINQYYHGDNADKLGYDIYTIDGNLAYAKILYQKFGTDPWSSSEKCWKSQTVAMK